MRCSSGKAGFSSRRKAQHAGRLVREGGVFLKAYPCGECGRWHLATVKGGAVPRASTARPTPHPRHLSMEGLEELAARMRAERCPPPETETS